MKVHEIMPDAERNFSPPTHPPSNSRAWNQPTKLFSSRLTTGKWQYFLLCGVFNSVLALISTICGFKREVGVDKIPGGGKEQLMAANHDTYLAKTCLYINISEYLLLAFKWSGEAGDLHVLFMGFLWAFGCATVCERVLWTQLSSKALSFPSPMSLFLWMKV